jgi:hypothetical protein
MRLWLLWTAKQSTIETALRRSDKRPLFACQRGIARRAFALR